MPAARLTVEEHRQRANRHLATGDVLAGKDECDWAAVCYFYAAYHLIRASLISDPIFEHPTLLSRINADLTMEDRHVTRHHGNKRGEHGRLWGVNDLVLLLYTPLAGSYERLHQASVDVRYGAGLRGDLAPIRDSLAAIAVAYEAGDIVTPLPA